MENLDEVPINPEYPNHTVQIGSMLDNDIKQDLIAFLSRNHDYFVWSHADMIGIIPSVMNA